MSETRGFAGWFVSLLALFTFIAGMFAGSHFQSFVRDTYNPCEEFRKQQGGVRMEIHERFGCVVEMPDGSLRRKP